MGAQPLEGAVETGQQGGHLRLQPPPGLREGDPARGAVDEPHAQGLLQAAEGTGERGLADAPHSGRAGEVLLLREGHEQPQVTQLDIHTREA